MSQTIWNQKNQKSGLWGLLALMVILLSAASCRTSQQASETPAQKTFASPEEAEAALIQMAQAGDQSALIAIFGPDSKAILFTGDSGTDQARLNDFVTAYNQMHRWKTIKAQRPGSHGRRRKCSFPDSIGEELFGPVVFRRGCW